MAEIEYTSVVWTAGDVITEAKLDNMTANDQAVNAHGQGSRYDARTAPADADVDSGEIHVYGKAHGALTHLHGKTGADDREHWYQPRSSVSLSDGATINIDWEDGNAQYVTLGGNRTLEFDNPKEGGAYILILTQDGAGSRTVTFPGSVKFPSNGTAPTLSSGSGDVDALGFVYVNSTWYGVGEALDLA